MQTTCRVFNWGDQEAFARLSCDRNPVHMNPAAARRTHVGSPIVHGIHSLLWLLDFAARSDPRTEAIKTLKVQFLQPIYVGDEVSAEILDATPRMLRARILTGSEEVVVAKLGFDDSPIVSSVQRGDPVVGMAPPESPNELELAEMKSMAGRLSMAPMASDIARLFPSAVSALGFQSVAGLAYSSCLVGMVVPGLHSIFCGLEASLGEDRNAPADAIDFAVQSVVPRFRLVRIGVWGRGLRGSLETINRMPPTRQPGMDLLTSHVDRGEFRNSQVLVVGGSRGLGELTAKLIAAGGGQVTITYASGRDDAQRVSEEIEGAGFRCAILPYDANRPAAEQLEALDMTPTHLYYYSTPPIFRRKDGLFDNRRFAEFNSFYVTAFFDLVHACILLRPQGIKVFYPSSSAIDDRPATMTEYSMSKAAAEILCADLCRFMPGVQVITRRLPRLPTDQTASTVNSEAIDPVAVILPIVREMHG